MSEFISPLITIAGATYFLFASRSDKYKGSEMKLKRDGLVGLGLFLLFIGIVQALGIVGK